MLLGLALAVLLALMLQLNALRVRRAVAFDLAGNGVIHLRAWIVVETGPSAGSALSTFAGGVLMIARRAVRAARVRRLFGAAKIHWSRQFRTRDPAVPADIGDIPWKRRGRRAAWSTGPPPWQVPRAAPIIFAAA